MSEWLTIENMICYLRRVHLKNLWKPQSKHPLLYGLYTVS